MTVVRKRLIRYDELPKLKGIHSTKARILTSQKVIWAVTVTKSTNVLLCNS